MNLSPITYAIEKGFRIFEDRIVFFHFFMIQFELKKQVVPDGDYLFSMQNLKNELIFQKEIKLDSINECIITHDSHEDPLVQTLDSYLICFQIDSELIPLLDYPVNVSFQNKNENIIAQTHIENLSSIYAQYKGVHYSKIINEYCLITEKKCVLTLHLGDNEAHYHEENFSLDAHEIFDFSKYIGQYSYIGVQCSYEDIYPEVEEKHIVIGQKGIYMSGALLLKDKKIMPPLPFHQKYQKILNDNELKEVFSLEDLFQNYKTNIPRYFESQVNFLLPAYLKYSTYNQDGLYSQLPPPKKAHVELEVCQQCPKAATCLQVIPSGLSSSLFKKNILLEKPEDCSVFKIISN